MLPQNPPSNSSSAMDGRILYDYQIGELEGRLLTLIEGLGLREGQEKAVKDMLKGIMRTALYIETTYVYGPHLWKALKSQDAEAQAIAYAGYGGGGTITTLSGTGYGGLTVTPTSDSDTPKDQQP